MQFWEFPLQRQKLGHKMPVFLYIGGEGAQRLPIPFFNILNGGKHAGNKADNSGLSSEEMVKYYDNLISKYPIISIAIFRGDLHW